MRYAANRLEGVPLAQIQPYVGKVTGYVKITNLKIILQMMLLAFNDQDHQTTAKRELSKLQQRNRDFSHYFAEFQH
jgi:hypothetical protein